MTRNDVTRVNTSTSGARGEVDPVRVALSCILIAAFIGGIVMVVAAVVLT